MKYILILFLLSNIICKNSNIIQEITNIIQCLSKSNIFMSELDRIKEAFNSKDIFNIINTIKISFNQLKYQIVECKSEIFGEITNEDYKNKRLGYPKYVYVLYTQIGENAFIWYDHGGLKYLKEQCHQYYGQTTWYCLYLSDK